MTRAIYFDMDGTIANLYGVENWLDNLMNEYTRPYREAKAMVNMRALGRELNRLQAEGYVIGVVSWLSKSGSDEYGERVAKAKREWLARHIGAVEWDEIHIVKYGTPKYKVVDVPNGILFDDEERNRKEWALGNGLAFGVENIVEILKGMR
jgi:hypothetical protein